MTKKRKAVKPKTVKKMAEIQTRRGLNKQGKEVVIVEDEKQLLEQPIERKLSMIDTFVTEKQLAFLLGKTPAQHIYERPAKGGGKWSYVTGVYITKVLNYVFGWNWSFEIKDKGREGDLVWVQGRLSIMDSEGKVRVIKEQFGRADIKFKKGTKDALDYGNDLKSASTDALKKCASELGIAGDVYGKNEFKEVGVKPPVKQIAPAPKKENSAVRQVKMILHKKGATTEAEALKVLEKETGLKWKNFNVSQKAYELALKALLNL